MKLDKEDLADEDIADDLRELNGSISSSFDIYIDFLNAYLQVHRHISRLSVIVLIATNRFRPPMKPHAILRNLTVPKD